VVAGALIALAIPGTSSWEAAINPALALMLFVTFLQVQLAELGRAFRQTRFLVAMLVINFIVVPLLVAIIVAQTLVELVAELIFIRVTPRLGS
jgi:ACR3 family arsenite transporter